MAVPAAERRANLVPVCFAPARYGGLSATRKHSAATFGFMWRCNRKVSAWGGGATSMPAWC
ncbi:hypothetical protein CHO01_36950 [Cellulomonas hominis]|uniref:Uncharacterized protein n=1 Tax=Cellulomonas hominis TaxID=156981 RepID=A0A511FH29_9CELL|nr:hypothetical protein [Cellulomonas hominis]GEL48579.1 hypothetical protein CHO01_36950 [Cellulomonas hominis]